MMHAYLGVSHDTQLQGARAHVTCYNRTQVSGVFESTDANQVSTESVLCRQGFYPSPPAWREHDGRRMSIPATHAGDEMVTSCMLPRIISMLHIAL